MSLGFSIARQWQSALHESPEVRETSAQLKILLGDLSLTRCEDEWSGTIQDEARLSAYPMALWIAASWWRLCWEPLPQGAPNTSWRMAHELTAAGYGYLWPRVLFASDGERVRVAARQTSAHAKSSLRYLTDADGILPLRHFERALEEFVEGVIARLNARNIPNTELHRVWEELREERDDAELSSLRRLEALLGFDAGDCPDNVWQQFEPLIAKAGDAAVAELAAACATAAPQASVEKVLMLAQARGFHGRIALPPIPPSTNLTKDAPAWLRGRALARQARSVLGLNGAAISDETLCGIVELPQAQAFNFQNIANAPAAVAIREGSGSGLKFVFRKRKPSSRRFELSRFIGDHMFAESSDSWLPVTNTGTARQKMQRAFAAEFLCPFESLREMMPDGMPTEDAIEDAAGYFNVDEKVVTSQLVNNHVLPRSALETDGEPIEWAFGTSTWSQAA